MTGGLSSSALDTSEGFSVGVGAAVWAEVRALLVVPPVAGGAFHRPPLFCAAQASLSAGLSRLAVRLTAGVFPAVLEATGGTSLFESTGGTASTDPRDQASSSLPPLLTHGRMILGMPPKGDKGHPVVMPSMGEAYIRWKRTVEGV